MKKQRWILLLSLLVLLVVSACASQAVTTQTTQQATVAQTDASQTAAQPTQPSEEQMLALLKEKLVGSPHTVEFILSQKKTAEQWSSTLDTMISYGAKINAEEKQLLINWLVNR